MAIRVIYHSLERKKGGRSTVWYFGTVLEISFITNSHDKYGIHIGGANVSLMIIPRLFEMYSCKCKEVLEKPDLTVC